jgi:competence protein ComEA
MKGVVFAKPLISAVFTASVLFFSQGVLSEQVGKQPEPAKHAEVAKPAHTHEAAVTSPINLNKADAQTLAQLHGIGEKKAQAIIAYREAKGGFKTVDELQNVKGIGQKFIDKNRSLLSIN